MYAFFYSLRYPRALRKSCIVSEAEEDLDSLKERGRFGTQESNQALIDLLTSWVSKRVK